MNYIPKNDKIVETKGFFMERQKKGFSLIELMIVVVIISILAAISIPQYQNYIRKSRTSEATANINSIALYEEQYFSENNEYITLNVNPAGIPNASDDGGSLLFDGTESTWIELGSVFPDGSPLRFQYEARAGQYDSDGSSILNGDDPDTDFDYVGNADCDQTAAYAPSDWVINAPFAWWFTIVAVGNQKDSPDGICSIFAKISSRTQLYSENEID